MTKKPFVMTVRRYEALCDEYAGICTTCGRIQHHGVEPDAHGYECEKCHNPTLTGIEELMIQGLIVIH